MKQPTKFLVCLRWPGQRPVPKFGQFTWNPNYGRLMWRNEIAETAGQLAELVNQALPFVRDQQDPFLWVEIYPVPVSEEEQQAEPNADLPTDVDELQSLVISLRQANDEKQATIDHILNGEPVRISNVRVIETDEPAASGETVQGPPADGKADLSKKISNLPRKPANKRQPRRRKAVTVKEPVTAATS